MSRPSRSLAALEAALPDVDARGRRPDGARLRRHRGDRGGSRGRAPVLAVGQHDDADAAPAALDAGADRVYAYRRLFEDGPRVVGRWLGGTGASRPAPRPRRSLDGASPTIPAARAIADRLQRAAAG